MDPERFLYTYIKLRGGKFRTDDCNGTSIHSLSIRPRGVPPDRNVVLLHGIGSSSAHFILLFFQLARQGYNVYIPDLPGHGLSGNTPEPLTSAALFETVVEWMRIAAPPQFHLVGNSLGGALAWRYAGRAPERVKKLVVMSPAVGFDTAEIFDNFVKSLEVPSKKAARVFLRRIMRSPGIVAPFFVPPIYRNMNRRAVRDLLESANFSELQLQDRLREVAIPTLLIWGKEDRILPRSNLAWIKRMIQKNVEVLEPEGVGHSPQLDAPFWLSKTLRTALAD